MVLIGVVAVGSLAIGCGGQDGEGTNVDAGPDAGSHEDSGGVDTTPPETRIVSAPDSGSPVTELPVVVEFELVDSNESVQFECRLNGESWEACDSPKRYHALSTGEYEFEVRAIDRAGNVEQEPSRTHWQYVSPPETTIDSGPDSVTTQTQAEFVYSATRVDEYECRIDGGEWQVCPDGGAAVEVEVGEHSFEVRASYLGVVDPSPAAHEWTVTNELDTGIDSHPDDPSTESSATFEFSGVHAEEFECQLDAAGWEVCTSPKTYEVDDGSHTFEVRAVGELGTVDPSPASYSWSVDTEAPTVTLTDTPADPSATNAAVFAFEADDPNATFECRLDAQSWSSCSSPESIEVDDQGAHTFEVRASDDVGNTSAPASHTWEIDVRWQAMSVGYEHSCGIQEDGSLWCWGHNDLDQLGVFGAPKRQWRPLKVGSAQDWEVLEAGGHHSCGIRADGTLWCWGNSASGQLGHGATWSGGSPVQVGTQTDWKSVSVGDEQTCGIRAGGTLWCWGDNSSGELGDGTTTERHSPVQVGSSAEWAAVDVAQRSTCAVKTDGTLWCWGDNNYGQLGDGTNTDRTTPGQVGSATTWESVSIGRGPALTGTHACAIRSDGTLWCWGADAEGQLGHDSADFSVPSQVGSDTDWQSVVADAGATCALKTSGQLWCWGNNIHGLLGVSGANPVSTPTRVGTRSDWSRVDVDGYDDYGLLHRHTCGLTDAGTLHCWGLNRNGELGIGPKNRQSPQQVDQTSSWSQLSAGDEHTCGVRTDGTLWCWGDGEYFRLGVNNQWIYDYPTQVGSGTDWESVSAGGAHSCGVRTDGTLWCWGYNSSGQLGLGSGSSNLEAPVPRQVGSDNDWDVVEANPSGYQYGRTCALKTDGSLWCWGNNADGLLGVGLTPDTQYTPALIDDGPYASLALDRSHRCAIKTEGTLWCWGRNADGQLGLGNSDDASSPTQVGSESDWSDVATGDHMTCATKTDGTLWCWGDHTDGKLGITPASVTYSPAQVGTDSNWASVSAGTSGSNGNISGHVCASRDDGTLWCWGQDSGGRLGNGSGGSQNEPGQVGTSTSWASVTAGQVHTCALDTSDALWCWGGNTRGQLGVSSVLTVTPSENLP